MLRHPAVFDGAYFNGEERRKDGRRNGEGKRMEEKELREGKE